MQNSPHCCADSAQRRRGGRPSLSTPTLVAWARGVETSGEPLTAASLSVHAKRRSHLLFFCEIAESSRKLSFQSKKKWFIVVNTFVLIVPIEWQDKTWRADSDFEGKNYLCWLDLTVKLVKTQKLSVTYVHGFKKLMKSIYVSLEELMKEIQVVSITKKIGNILFKQNIFKFV